MNIVKVTFKPKPKAPANCKDISYLVNEQNIGIALITAKEVFVSENKHHNYYRDAIAANQRVL